MAAKWRTCCTCGPFKPKWMKMVDNIYKTSDSSHHNKLLQFCVRKPDKLDRVSLYLYKNLAYDLGHNNASNVYLSMEAITTLMNACHQRLNLFVVNYLKMVQLLLESTKTDHQLLGCKSFMQFSQLSEDTPCYHKEYEYLIQHFSKLAHYNSPAGPERDKLRASGIKGINGVVRKCTMDQLQVNLLDLRCLNLIIPAYLFNINITDSLENGSMEELPANEALLAFREIVSCGSVNIQPVISSIFTFLDSNKLWHPPEFSLFVFDNFLENIKNTQAANTLMKQLINHLTNENNQFSPSERTGIVKAINITVKSLASQVVGPDIFQNFKSLLQILRQSIQLTPVNTNKTSANTDISPGPEKMFQEAIISTIAEFAKNLPDTQKIEIMKFILNFDSMCFDRSNRSRQFVRVLLKTMLQIATQYKTGSIAIIFNFDFLNLLLNGVAVDIDPGNRIFVQKILHTLIDRHDNSQKLSKVEIISQQTLFENFKFDKPSRQDLIFMKKNGAAIIENLFLQIIDATNKVDNLENIFCTLSLISMEMGAEHVVVDLYRLVLGVQDYVLENSNKGTILITQQCAIHALLCAFINILSMIADLPQVVNHVNQVTSQRKFKAKYYLPEVAFNRNNTANSYPNQVCKDDNCFFSKAFVKERLAARNYDTSSFEVPFKCKPGAPVLAPYMAQGEMQDLKALSTSMTSLSISESGSNIIEEEAEEEIQAQQHQSQLREPVVKHYGDNEYAFESMKKLLEEPNEERNKRRMAREMEMSKYFREVGFEKIYKDQKEKYQPYRHNLQEIINYASPRATSPQEQTTPGNTKVFVDLNGSEYQQNVTVADNLPNIWEIEYPDIFVS